MMRSALKPFANHVRLRDVAAARLRFNVSDQFLGQSHGEGFHESIVLHAWQACNTQHMKRQIYVLTVVVITTIVTAMKTTIQNGHYKRATGNVEEAAFLDLLRTCDILSRGLLDVLKPAELSPTQYNVLRILRGAKEGLMCGQIASRMITRDPDITRLLDRMEKRGLISRSRDTKDRRVVLTRITQQGLKMLAGLDGPILAAHRKQLGHLGAARLKELAELLREMRREAA